VLFGKKAARACGQVNVAIKNRARSRGCGVSWLLPDNFANLSTSAAHQVKNGPAVSISRAPASAAGHPSTFGPNMKNQDAILRTGFAVFSAVTSFLFVAYSVNVIAGDAPSQWLTAFAYVTGGYGLANIYILSWAWRNRADWPLLANKFFALCFFGVFVADRLSQGLENLMQVLGILALAGVLLINWFAVKKLCQRQ
jgi:hypothetical protein